MARKAKAKGSATLVRPSKNGRVEQVERVERVQRRDIEAKLAEIQHAIGRQAETQRDRLIPAGIVAAVLLILIAYVLGRRKGKKKTTVVEIRRV